MRASASIVMVCRMSELHSLHDVIHSDILRYSDILNIPDARHGDGV